LPDENTRGLWYFNRLPGDATVPDASGNNNTATLITGHADQLDPNTSWDTGQPGYNRCIKTGGTNIGPIEVPQSAGNTSLAFSPGEDMAIEFWMNPSEYPASGLYYILQKYSGGDYSVYLSANGKLSFGWSSSGWWSADDITLIPLNTWTQVAITVDRSSDPANDLITFYINGKFSSTHTSEHKGGSPNTESLWLLGRFDGNSSYNYRGKLDELKISDEIPDYLPPFEINWIKMVGDDIQFAFSSKLNSFYKIYSANSPTGTWTEIQDVLGQANETTVTVANALVGSNSKFFKVEKSAAPPPFTDVSLETGLSAIAHWPGAWGDYDNDGWVDFYRGGTTNGTVLHNNGGTFSAVQSDLVGYLACWGDYDNDGDPDLLTWDAAASSIKKLYRNDTGTFVDRSVDLTNLPPTVIYDALWGDWDKDGDLDIYWSSGDQAVDVICWNNGPPTWTFTAQQQSAAHYGRGVAAADYDSDNDPDIYVSCYWLTPNQLLQNDGTGTFTDVGPTLGVTNGSTGATHSVGSAWADVDNDGDFDLLMANFSHPYNPPHEFFENTGGSFTSRGMAGMGWIEEYTNALLFDYDNDGDLDLYYTVFDYIAPADNDVLYTNNGDWTFSFVQLPESMEEASGFSAACADYDNDGDLDLFTMKKLFRNDANLLRPDNHWLKVKLIGNGTTVNTGAVGAEARIDLGGDVILLRQVGGGMGGDFGNQSESTLHFGLGENSGPVDVEITWPDGSVQVVSTSVDIKITIQQ